MSQNGLWRVHGMTSTKFDRSLKYKIKLLAHSGFIVSNTRTSAKAQRTPQPTNQCQHE